LSPYNNRETETKTELGQVRDTQRRMDMVQGQAGYGQCRVG